MTSLKKAIVIAILCDQSNIGFLQGPRPLLLFGSASGIHVASLKSPRNVLARVRGTVNAVAVDYWLEGNLIFWTDTVLRMIKSANLNGTMITDVIKFGLERPCEYYVQGISFKRLQQHFSIIIYVAPKCDLHRKDP